MGGWCQAPLQLLSTTRSLARLVNGRATAPIAERRNQVWCIGHGLIQVRGYKRVARWAQCDRPGMGCDLTEFIAPCETGHDAILVTERANGRSGTDNVTDARPSSRTCVRSALCARPREVPLAVRGIRDGAYAHCVSTARIRE